jgi:hypothetical protein
MGRIAIAILLSLVGPWVVVLIHSATDDPWVNYATYFFFLRPAEFIALSLSAYRISRLTAQRFWLLLFGAPLFWAYWAAVPQWWSPSDLKPFWIEWVVVLTYGVVVLPVLAVLVVLLDWLQLRALSRRSAPIADR